MKVNSSVRIVPTDFPPEAEEIMDPLADILNPFIDSTSSVLNSGFTFSDNYSGAYLTINTRFNSAGIPDVNNIPLKIKQTATSAILTRIRNTENQTSIISSNPYMDYDFLDGSLIIKKITNLQANQNYELRILVITS